LKKQNGIILSFLAPWTLRNPDKKEELHNGKEK